MEDLNKSEEKKGNEKDIFLFWNGQSVSPPRKFHLDEYVLHSWENTLTHLARLEYDSTYPAIQLHTLDGKVLNSPKDLVDGATYVAVPQPETFVPSGYGHYLDKATRSREKRLAKTKSGELDRNNTEKSKDIQTDDHSIDIPADNIVVVNRLVTDIKIQKPIQSNKPNNVQRPSSTVSSPRTRKLVPLKNQPGQRFPGVGQLLGPSPVSVTANNTILNKRQPNSRNGARSPRPCCTDRTSSSGRNNSDVKTVPDVKFSRKINGQNSKIPTLNYIKRPENSMNKLKLPPIQNASKSDPFKITSRVKNNETLSNKTSRPTNTETYSKVIDRTTDEIVSNARKAFLKKIDAVQSGKIKEPIPTKYKTYNLLDEINKLTTSSPISVEPTIENKRNTLYDAKLSELSFKFIPNMPTDLEKIVKILEQTDPINLIKKQSGKIDPEIVSEIEMTEQLSRSSSKQSTEENLKGVTLNEHKMKKSTRFSNDIKDLSMTSSQSTPNKEDNSTLVSTTSNLTDVDRIDNTNAYRGSTVKLTHNRIAKSMDLDKKLVVMQAIDDPVGNNDRKSVIKSENLNSNLNTQQNKSENGRKSNELLKPNLSVRAEEVILKNSLLTEVQNSTIIYSPGHTDVLEHADTDAIPNKTDISDHKPIPSTQNVIIKPNTSLPVLDAKIEVINRNDPEKNTLHENAHHSSPQDTTVIPDLDKSSNKNIDLVSHSDVEKDIGILNRNADARTDENINTPEENFIAPGQTVSKQIPMYSSSSRDLDSSQNRDHNTGTLETIFSSPDNVKSTIMQTLDSPININKLYIHERSAVDMKPIYTNSVIDGVNVKLEKYNNNKMQNFHSFDNLNLDGPSFAKDINKLPSDTLEMPTPVPKLSIGTFQNGAQCQKKFMVFVRKGDQVNLQVNIEVRSASGTLKSKHTIDANKSNPNASTKKDESNDDAKLTQSKSLQSADDIDLPHTCCQKSRKLVVNKCPCCDRIAPDAANIERITNLPFQSGIQPYYVLMPVMPSSTPTDCCRKPETCDKQIQNTESILNVTVESCQEDLCDKQKLEKKSVSIVAESVLTQTSCCLVPRKCNQDTQTEWCDMLLEARLHEDGHYTFFLPPLSALQQYMT